MATQGPHPQFFFIVLNPLTIKTLGLRSKKEDANFSNLASGSGIPPNETLSTC